MRCHHFEAGTCRSCTLLGTPYDVQLAAKQQRVASLLGFGDEAWLPPVPSAEAGFRNKAKMTVTGTASDPVLTLPRAGDEPDDQGGADAATDLTDCPLYPRALREVFPAVRRLVARAQVPPYDVARRRGELKHVVVSCVPTGELLVRFVLRTEGPVPRLREHLPILLAHPGVRVVSVNLQPEHAAVLEGEREIVLTAQQSLPVSMGPVTLRLRPRSFFQTNTGVARALYAQVAQWADDVAPARLVDLFCGVGGFALHCAAPDREVLGVELSADAVAAAQEAAREQGIDAELVAGDAAATVLATPAGEGDLVVLNPPRRGIGRELCAWLERGSARHVVYSSCNPTTLARDLAALPSYRVAQARLFDMFPHTEHAEVAVLLARR